MIKKDAIMTYHALERFRERYINGKECKNPEKTFRKLCSTAKEITYDNKRNFMRLLSNQCKEVSYYLAHGHVIVYSKKNNTVVTIEPKLKRREGIDFEYVDKGTE